MLVLWKDKDPCLAHHELQIIIITVMIKGVLYITSKRKSKCDSDGKRYHHSTATEKSRLRGVEDLQSGVTVTVSSELSTQSSPIDPVQSMPAVHLNSASRVLKWVQQRNQTVHSAHMDLLLT